ncbi:MAG TPA: methyl-accepting chemotaxis protein [Kofleriaceae bacterium]|nr:methyl-accepting chemotaxis protein [Kofleriaceae bacterium]
MWPFSPLRRRAARLADGPAPAVDADRLRASLGGLRRRVVARLHRVNAHTSRETLAAGRALEQLVQVGREHIERLRNLLDRKLGSEGADLAHAVRAQSERVRAGLDSVSTALERHRAEVADAAGHAGQITAAAGAIARLTSEARSLALNARIEAARAGEHARGFATIAEQMKLLSDAIAAANTTVNLLGKTLGVSLPVLEEQSKALGAEAAALGQELREGMAHVERQVQSLHDDVAAALTDSDRAVGQMVAASHAALSHLQFQDVCAQQLLAIDAWVRELQVETAADGEQVEAPAHPVVDSGDGEPAQEAGDVILF